MKKISLLLAALALSVAGSAIAQSADADSALIKRITPVGSVCVEGKACDGVALPVAAAPAATTTAAPAAADGPQARFAKVCSACHGNPAMAAALGAPQKGDKAAWAPRVAQGEATLLNHIHNGYKSMPAKGNCPDCTDDEYKALIHYMSN